MTGGTELKYMTTRSEKIVKKLEEREVDYFFAFNFERSSTTVRYLSGFTGDTGCVLIGEKERYIIVDSRFYTQAAQESDFEMIKVDSGSLIDKVSEIVKGKKIAIEPSKFFYSWYMELAGKVKHFEDLEEFILQIRAVKDDDEINKIRKAIDVAQKALGKTLENFHAGMSEKQFSSLLEYEMVLGGAQKPSFDTIVGSGYRGALPHGLASDKKMENGEMVVVDFGAFVDGYCSDLTRTFAIGNVSEKAKNAYVSVLDAQLKAIEGSKAGMKGKEIDAIARTSLKANKLDQYFGHGLGHGLGMDVHESPFLNTKCDEVINDKTVITFEPGVYIPGEFGIRIEDDVLLTESGHEVLSNFNKKFTVI
jgi:Xaa-Pro aminopeptidase|uniref:Aminopeptidase P family protein n=1 Tax=Mesoaciditoga lauensis TaxID=1495039 RepID=A0A7V3RE49_9BACT